jgi:sugar lactone lactonase YvrE
VWITAAGPPEIPGSGSAPARAGGAGRGTGGGGQGRGAAAAPPARPQDAHVLKFTRTGQFLLQIGKAGHPGDNDSTTGLNRPAGISVDAGEVFIADGFGNHRIAVFDAETGAYKRQWDATAAAPAALNSVSCVKVARDGTVYVCDRGHNRVAAYDKSGTARQSGVVSPDTKATGSVWDLAFSSDPDQRYLFVADGHDQRIFLLRRDTLETIGGFGDGGRYPGTFYGVGSIAVDGQGNIYTGENLEGKRVQKFVPKGARR